MNMNRPVWKTPIFWISWCAVLGLLAIFVFGFSTDPRKVPSPLIGKAAPNFVARELGGTRTLQLKRLGTPILLNFWASWCVECQAEARVLENFHQKQLKSENPVTVLGIAIQDNTETARAFARRFGKSYFLALDDPSGSIALDYGIYGVPETFFIDASGIIRHKHIGGVTSGLLRKQQSLLLPQ